MYILGCKDEIVTLKDLKNKQAIELASLTKELEEGKASILATKASVSSELEKKKLELKGI